MSLSDELKKLADLYDDGVLTADEFAEAKRQLLHPETKPLGKSVPEPSSLASAAETYIQFKMVMGIIGFIISVIFFLVVWLPMFSRMQ